MPLEFPLELTDLICGKLKRRKLSRICCKNMDKNNKNSLYFLNRKRLEKFWRKGDVIDIVKDNILQGIKYITANGITSKNDALVYSSQFGLLSIVKYLVGIKARITYQTLISATDNNHLHVVEYLISRGVNIREHNDEALMRTVCRGHLDIVKLLVKYGADIKAQNNNAVISACSNGYLELAKYLVEMGADIKAKNDEALIGACIMGYLDIVKYLVSLGADITVQNNKTIIYASEFGYFKIVKYLVSLGADPLAQNNEAIYLAILNGHYKIVEYLKEKGAVSAVSSFEYS